MDSKQFHFSILGLSSFSALGDITGYSEQPVSTSTNPLVLLRQDKGSSKLIVLIERNMEISTTAKHVLSMQYCFAKFSSNSARFSQAAKKFKHSLNETSKPIWCYTDSPLKGFETTEKPTLSSVFSFDLLSTRPLIFPGTCGISTCSRYFLQLVLSYFVSQLVFAFLAYLKSRIEDLNATNAKEGLY